jgi:hypothetical protein
MNRNTKDISADFLLRLLYALGYTAKIRFLPSLDVPPVIHAANALSSIPASQLMSKP